MGYGFDLGGVVGMVSGLAIGALGLAVLSIRPRRGPTVAFSAFAVLWGLQLIAANASQLATDADTARPWIFAFMALAIPLYWPLLYFTLLHPTPLYRGARGAILWATALVPGALLLVLLATAPDLFVQDVVQGSIGPRVIQGPLFRPVGFATTLLVFVIAGAIALVRLRRATDRSAQAQAALLAGAFAAYVSFRAVDGIGVIVDGGGLLETMGAPWAIAQWMVVGAATAFTIATAVVALSARHLEWRGLLLFVTTVPAAAGAIEWYASAHGIEEFETIGLWRLLMVALFAYAIARYRLFDIELKLKDAAPVVAYVVATVVGLATIWIAFGDSFSNVPLLGITASLGVAAVCVPAVSLGRTAIRRAAPQLDEPEYLYKRKMDVYRAALEEAHAKGMGKDTEQVFLTDLRRRLSITEAEHRVLLLVLESQEKYEKRPPAPAAPSKFHIERELGRGSFGRAVLARDTVLDRPVVLKQPLAPWMLDEEGRKLFLQEAKLAARINHPNVVQVYEILPDADPPMLVLEYVEGGSLETLLEAEGVLSADRVVAVGLDVLAGLEQIHKAGIVHRDMKPANILLTQEGRAKVTDFGIAHPPKSFASSITAAATNIQPGSLAYMSPEQARGDAVDKRSDLYSVGVVMYQAATGRHYLDFKASSEFKARQLIQTGKPRAMGADVPKPLAAVITKALEKDPEERYASAAVMAKAMKGK